MSVLEEIAAERQRQVELKGWNPKHDDGHQNYQLSSAAVCYANMGAGGPFSHPTMEPPCWPWRPEDWKPSPSPRRNLIKAAALIVDEIERLDRMDGR